MSETVHIAGVVIDIGGRYLRQRCSCVTRDLDRHETALMETEMDL